jgi:hypothetical protein
MQLQSNKVDFTQVFDETRTSIDQVYCKCASISTSSCILFASPYLLATYKVYLTWVSAHVSFVARRFMKLNLWLYLLVFKFNSH